MLTNLGVEIISNSSGSHHELKKLDTRVNLITQATKLVQEVFFILQDLLLTRHRAAVSTCMLTNRAVMAIAYTTTAVR